jgi:hypothetical protein
MTNILCRIILCLVSSYQSHLSLLTVANKNGLKPSSSCPPGPVLKMMPRNLSDMTIGSFACRKPILFQFVTNIRLTGAAFFGVPVLRESSRIVLGCCRNTAKPIFRSGPGRLATKPIGECATGANAGCGMC